MNLGQFFDVLFDKMILNVSMVLLSMNKILHMGPSNVCYIHVLSNSFDDALNPLQCGVVEWSCKRFLELLNACCNFLRLLGSRVAPCQSNVTFLHYICMVLPCN